MCAPERHLPRRAQRGLSIVELMVGIVVSMLVGLAAAGSAMMFGASQRQGMGVGGSSLGAASALAAVKNDVALAGLGFFGDSAYLCNALQLSTAATVHVDGTDFSPVSITAGADGDQVDIVYGERVESGANVLLDAPSDGSTAELMSLLPVSAGQAVLLAPATPGTPCLVRSVTAVAASTDTTPQTLTFANTGLHNQGAFDATPAFAERDRITLLGALNWHRYRREGNTLLFERPMTGDSAVLARDVVAMRAQYGVSTAAGETRLDSWEDAAGDFASLEAAELPRVRALRLGLVTRSPQRDKPDADGNCQATLTLPQLFGEDIEPDVDDWQCYRFRVAVVVVPLRNLVLGLRE